MSESAEVDEIVPSEQEVDDPTCEQVATEVVTEIIEKAVDIVIHIEDLSEVEPVNENEVSSSSASLDDSPVPETKADESSVDHADVIVHIEDSTSIIEPDTEKEAEDTVPAESRTPDIEITETPVEEDVKVDAISQVTAPDINADDTLPASEDVSSQVNEKESSSSETDREVADIIEKSQVAIKAQDTLPVFIGPIDKKASNSADKEVPVEKEEFKDDTLERGGWNNKLDFLFSCISVSVGLGNIWRFPYLCFRNGGGTFLVTYFTAMIFCGIPIFYQEVALGQYLGVGGMSLIGQLAPIMKGVGFATMIIVFFIDIYYCVIIAWTLFYLIASFTAIPGLPWQACGNPWNTVNCYVPNDNVSIVNESVSAVEEFWNLRVLGISSGIEAMGSMRLELMGALVLAWVLVYLIIWKGINQSGYIIWFTALFPYVILSVLLVRAVTLEGAATGLFYYISPKWDMLLTSGPWIDGATQIFFAYSIGSGALPALGSYNKFNHNCYRDAIITCIVNTITCLLAGVVTFSILGNIAFVTNSSVESVVSSGPGLVFITYPEVVLRLPGAPAWAILFFIMLAILGIDSEFCMVESFVTGIVDNWPEKLRKHRRYFTFGSVVLMLLLSLPMVTEGGVYLFQLMDYYSASGMSLLYLVFFQTISISWIFGGKKFCDCIFQMTGQQPSRFFYFCWVFFAPVVMLAIFIFYCLQYTAVTYGKDYHYPKWAEMFGIGISIVSMMWVPLYAIYYVMTTPGTLREVLAKGVTPIFKVRSSTAGTEKDNEKCTIEDSNFHLNQTGSSVLLIDSEKIK